MWRNPQSKTATIAAQLVPIWEMNAGTAEKDLISNSVDPYSIEIDQWSEAGSKQAGRPGTGSQELNLRVLCPLCAL